jgi:hypothetical protein
MMLDASSTYINTTGYISHRGWNRDVAKEGPGCFMLKFRVGLKAGFQNFSQFQRILQIKGVHTSGAPL